MARLTEEMVIARSKQSDLASIKKLNCWGAELGDVTVLKRMPNVEVLAFSVNKIRVLSDFSHCLRLRELYLRKNEIRDLAEIRHLRGLTRLTNLWLEENPCAEHPEYRYTVLRNLPNLEKLDNVTVQTDELQEAMRRGLVIQDSDDENYSPQQETYSEYRRPRSEASSPEREPEQYYNNRRNEPTAESCEDVPPETNISDQCRLSQLSPSRRSSPEDERYEVSPPQHTSVHPQSSLTRSHYDSRGSVAAEGSLRHSFSAQSVRDYNGDCRLSHYQDCYPDRSDSRQNSDYSYPPAAPTPQQRQESGWSERDRDRERERDGNSHSQQYSAVMADARPGFTRRPVTRNSNLLSALLCLVKELDYPSLEVAEMAVRCRMDELANSQ